MARRIVAGVDEVGRGPLAGPVVVAAVILNRRRIPDGLNDSKQLTADDRARLHDEIMRDVDGVGRGGADVDHRATSTSCGPRCGRCGGR